MLFLFGIPSEPPMALLAEAAERAGVPLLVLNQRQAAHAALEVGFAAGRPFATLEIGGQRHRLQDMQGYYLRPIGVTDLPEHKPHGRRQPDAEALFRADALTRGLVDWSDIAPGAVANRARAMGSNASKPYQAQLIRACGLAVPETLVTNSAGAVREFHARHGRLIFKSISGVRSIVREWTADMPLERLAALPTQFQALLPGTDVRVHVAGEQLLAHRVHSAAIDYRYGARDGLPTEIEATELPAAIAEACVRLTRDLGLLLAGIDLREGPDGQWSCFEVNPSPAYSYYQGLTGQDIAGALLAALRNA